MLRDGCDTIVHHTKRKHVVASHVTGKKLEMTPSFGEILRPELKQDTQPG